MLPTFFLLIGLSQVTISIPRDNNEFVQAAKKPVQAVFRHDENILNAAFSPDGKLLALIGEKSGMDAIRIWDLATQKEVQRISTHLHSEFAFSPNGKTIAVGNLDGLSLIDIDAKPQTRLLLKSRFVPWVADLQRGTEVTGLSFSGDGKSLVCADFTGEITLIDVKTTAPIRIREGTPGPFLAFDCLVRISPDGKRIAYTSKEGPIGLWDIAKKKRISVFNGHSGAVISLQFSSDSDILVSACWDGTLRVWGCRNGKELITLQVGKEGVENDGCCGALSPSQKEVATGGNNGAIKIWDLRTRKVIREMQGPRSGIMDLKYHPDGTYLVSTGEENVVRFWDPKTGEQLKK